MKSFRWLALLLFCPMLNAATWYVRADGGTRSQCTGTTDAAYSGTGTGQPCGFKDARWLWDNQAGTIAWIIAGGDTVILESAASIAAVSGLVAASTGPPNRIGWDFGGPCSGAGCGAGFTWCQGVGSSCGAPPPPAGTTANPTHIWGANHGNCSTMALIPGGLYMTLVPDPTKMFEMYGDFGANTVIDLSGTTNVDVECIHITTHGDCIIHYTGSVTTVPFCQTPSDAPPLSNYASEGIRFSSTSCTGTYGCNIQDVWISGMQDSGTIGPISATGLVKLNNVRASYNIEAGINFDDGTDPLPAGAQIVETNVTVDFNGYNQKWPFVTAIPVDLVSSQSIGGDGDGVATPGSSFGTFTVTNFTGAFNAQDCHDVGHNQQPGSVTFTASICWGNFGGTFKSGGQSASIINSVSLGNCRRAAATITGLPAGFTYPTTDLCRAAGDTVGVNWLGGGSNETIKIQNSFMYTYTGVQIDFQIQGTGTCTSCIFDLDNNVMVGYLNTNTGSVHTPTVWNTLTATEQSNNTIYNYFGYTCAGTDQCVDPLLVGEAPPTTNVGDSFGDAFNFNLSSSSPARASSPLISGIVTDYFGKARVNPTSAGAAQFLGVTSSILGPVGLTGRAVSQ